MKGEGGKSFQKPFSDNLDNYFTSYSHAGIHEEMIKDDVRTNTYRNAILNNPHLFKNKVVLDVGCGTGILSLFAARAGAKRVYGIDMSSIAIYAQKIVEANNLEKVITIINGKVEEVELPGNDKVDIIISEWMGYALLFESMLETVIVARDKWLKPNGLIFPDIANLYVCGIEDAFYKNEKIEWWESVYGFNMSCMKELAICEPFVDYVEGKFVTTTSSLICKINLNTVTIEELSIYSGSFDLMFKNDDYVHALILYFDVEFSACHTKTILSTSPLNNYTHWKHAIFYLKDVIIGKAREKITGSITMEQNATNKRHLDYNIKVQFEGNLMTAREENLYYMR